MSTRAKCLIVLIGLMILDILPIPIVGLIGLYVIIKRPRWFLEVTNRLYDEGTKSAVSAEEEI
ncbi:hypothetical protein [Methylocaldum szegediense]|uniref:Uncharacterized protein n=1 Tax=Methylocaldum szegediense TaxID=73780 RepID=A0ABN8X3T2_9GAMM|nr:hypothetical protein [Methylocaldum szegediense]CAI8801543.1 conserved protein of unknown function [Methylocaldum szegediense]